ncbi:MAG: histidine kinase [Bacteroidota bacterium]
MNFKSGLAIFIFCAITSVAYAGYPYYKNFNINDGLPSNKVYNILEDRYGFIWISTDKGVSRYDGVSFVNFTTREGLPDNDVIGLYEDAVGRIWFQGFSSEPCYYKSGKIYNSKNDTFIRRVKKHRPYGVCMFVLIKQNKSIGFIIEQNNKKLIVGKDIEDIEFKKTVKLSEVPYQQFLIQTGNTYDKISPADWYDWNKGDSSKKIVNKAWGGLLQEYALSMFYSEVPEGDLYGLDPIHHQIWKIRPSNNTATNFKIAGNFNGLYSNKKYHALVADSTYTVYNIDFSKKIEKQNLPFAFKRIFIDSKGNKWLGSFDNGIYLVRSNTPVKIPLPSGLEKGLLAIKHINGHILLETETNGLLVLDKNNNCTQYFREKGNKTTTGIVDIGDGYIMGNETGGLVLLDQNFKVIRQLLRWAVKDIEKGGKNEILIGARENSYIYHTYPKDTIIYIDIRRTTAICRANQTDIWLGGLKGINKYSIKGKHMAILPLNIHPDIANSRIVDIKNDGSGNMWVATDQKGLFYCPLKGGIIRFTEGSGDKKLLSDMCLQLLVPNSKEVWLATTKGISKINHTTKGFTVVNYSVPEGLPGISVNSIALMDSGMYVATPDGLYQFKVLQKSQNETSRTLITQVKVNDSIYAMESLELPYKKNNLIISYASSFINSGNEYRFKYRVKGLNAGWIETNTLQIPLLGIEPGDYNFEIVAVNAQGMAGPMNSFHFVILTPWFRQWWFYGLIAAIVLAIFAYYYILLKEKIDLNKNLDLLRLRILRAQMNPHFVFNALSNIQRLIQIQNLKNAEQYIGTLASIMRKSLDYSAKEFIPLNKEVDYTANYLEIEKMRFDDKFNFNIVNELSADDQEIIFVPPMILQPLVENAVKHAFKGIAHTGELNITIFKTESHLLTYIIEDNGSGFKNTVITGHGLKITRDRLKLLYKDKPVNASMNINSVANAGTIITIELPILND